MDQIWVYTVRNKAVFVSDKEESGNFGFLQCRFRDVLSRPCRACCCKR